MQRDRQQTVLMVDLIAGADATHVLLQQDAPALRLRSIGTVARSGGSSRRTQLKPDVAARVYAASLARL
jgi:hypothetical protein